LIPWLYGRIGRTAFDIQNERYGDGGRTGRLLLFFKGYGALALASFSRGRAGTRLIEVLLPSGNYDQGFESLVDLDTGGTVKT
jgi:hypothetical protein